MVNKHFYISFLLVFALVLGACGVKPPIDDDTPPGISIVASDSTYNPNNKYSYMRYDDVGPGYVPFSGTIGPRYETGFVTKDGSVNLQVKGYDPGGIKSIVVRAQNGTITPGKYIGPFPTTLEVTTEGDTDVLVFANAGKYANTPLDHTIAISPKTDNPEVIVSVEVFDMGGISGRSNSTKAPDIILAFSAQ
ncbi:MAG: hypothetical protein AAF462_08835 [Thermodesulfobacteriota bacterium]